MAKQKQNLKKNKLQNPFKKLKSLGGKVTHTIGKLNDAGRTVINSAFNKTTNKIVNAFKDAFTFQGSETLTNVTNTLTNIKSAIDDPETYAKTYVKRKVLNAVINVITGAVSGLVTLVAGEQAGETIKKAGEKINKKLTTAKKEETETQQEQQEQQEQGPLTSGIEKKEESEEGMEKDGIETNGDYILHALNSLPTTLLVVSKKGDYFDVDITAYKEQLLNAYNYAINQNGIDTYETSNISEFISLYEEFNRQYASFEGENAIQINFEGLYNWLLW